MKKVYIEISDICSLSCSFCPAPKNTRGIMNLSLFEHCMRQVKPICRNIALHILGDPCRLANLKEYLAIAQYYEMQVDVVTSGVFLKLHSPQMLLASPIHQLSISLEAGFDNHIKGYFDEIVDFALLHRQNPQCFLNLRIQDSRIFQDKTLLAKILDSLESETKEFDSKSRIRLWHKAFLVVKKSFVWAGYGTHQSESKKCHALKEQIGILSNGIVVPCCIDANGTLALGDIHTQTLAKILESKKAQDIKEGFRQTKAREELCKNCNYPA